MKARVRCFVRFRRTSLFAPISEDIGAVLNLIDPEETGHADDVSDDLFDRSREATELYRLAGGSVCVMEG